MNGDSFEVWIGQAAADGVEAHAEALVPVGKGHVRMLVSVMPLPEKGPEQ